MLVPCLLGGLLAMPSADNRAETDKALNGLTRSVIQKIESAEGNTGWLSRLLIRFGFQHAPSFEDKEIEEGDVESFSEGRFISVSVGDVTRLTVLSPGGRALQLPERLRWLEPWDVRPYRLGPDLFLLEENSRTAEGVFVPIGLEWLRLSSARGTVVGRFEGVVNLDGGQPKIMGDEVSLVIEPQCPHVGVTGGMSFLETRMTWGWRGERPVLLRCECLHPVRRAVCDAIEAAKTAGRPTALQRRIRRLTSDPDSDPKDYYLVDEWKETADSLTFNRDLRFTVKKSARGLEVVSVEEVPQPRT